MVAASAIPRHGAWQHKTINRAYDKNPLKSKGIALATRSVISLVQERHRAWCPFVRKGPSYAMKPLVTPHEDLDHLRIEMRASSL